MDIDTLTCFFKWCTIVNGCMFVFAGLMFLLMPDFIYRLHSRWIAVSREAFNAIIYASLTFFKIIFIVFNLVPWLVLEAVGSTTI